VFRGLIVGWSGEEAEEVLGLITDDYGHVLSVDQTARLRSAMSG